jgi:hypothetical protein
MKKLIKQFLTRIAGRVIRGALQDEFEKLKSDFNMIHDRLDNIHVLMTQLSVPDRVMLHQDVMLVLNKLANFIPQEPYSIQTEHSVAISSNDHKRPRGTKNDNTRSPRFVTACERHFPGEKLHFVDLGCSGGGLVLDFLLRGHQAVGLEGSDYSQKSQRAEWRLLDKSNLFTADITKPFQIHEPDGSEFKAHVVSAWEVMEHIPEQGLPQLFTNISNMLDKHRGGGICWKHSFV